MAIKPPLGVTASIAIIEPGAGTAISPPFNIKVVNTPLMPPIIKAIINIGFISI